MIDEKLVETIHTHGVDKDLVVPRRKVLVENLCFKMDQKAEYVITGGCYPPLSLPHVFLALKNFLDHFQVSYSFLSKEYCCGWRPFGQPAVMSKNDQDIAKSREISRDLVRENFKQAEALGAKAIVLFCSACEPAYSNYQDTGNLEVISYIELLAQYFNGGRLQTEIDYYAGCYRFRRRITSVPLNLEPALQILQKIEGLKINYLDNSLCCYIPPHLENLTKSMQTNTVATICSGCHSSLQAALKDKQDYRVRMLPEFVWESING